MIMPFWQFDETNITVTTKEHNIYSTHKTPCSNLQFLRPLQLYHLPFFFLNPSFQHRQFLLVGADFAVIHGGSPLVHTRPIRPATHHKVQDVDAAQNRKNPIVILEMGSVYVLGNPALFPPFGGDLIHRAQDRTGQQIGHRHPQSEQRRSHTGHRLGEFGVIELGLADGV